MKLVSDRPGLQGIPGCGGGELRSVLPTPRVQGETPAPPALREKRLERRHRAGIPAVCVLLEPLNPYFEPFA